MVPAPGLLDTFKLQDHQSAGMPIPFFDDFTSPTLHQVCSPIPLNGCTDTPQVFSHALQIEDLKISDHIGRPCSEPLSCPLPYCSPWLLFSPSSATLASSLRFQSCWEGMRSARLNLLDAFSQAMISVSSTSASSS